MSAHVQALLDHRQAVIKARAVESLSEAQAALNKASARYDEMPSSSRAYDKAAAKDRVAAARARGQVPLHLRCAELQTEWRENGWPV